MEDIIQLLAFILPIIALFGIIAIVFINIYLKIRRYFPVKVNCWFCNQWTKVHYDEQNCFECPSCLQYNGFNLHGDYNKPIPAQHDELLNQQLPLPENPNGHSTPTTNGLCHLCNNNQQLKIFQLANFIPLNEANYDVEIEHFQKQLEKAYKLCPPCENVVKTTLQKQTCLLGLKLTELSRRGVKLLDLNRSHDGISKKAKRSFLMKLLKVVLVSFAFLNVIYILSKIDCSDKNLKRHTPKWLLVYVVTLKNFLLLALSVFQNVWENILNSTGFNILSNMFNNVIDSCKSPVNSLLKMPFIEEVYSQLIIVWTSFNNKIAVLVPSKLPKSESATLLCFAGFLLQFICLVWSDKSERNRRFVGLFMWIASTLFHWKYSTGQYLNVYINILHVIVSIIIIASIVFTKKPKPFKQKKMKRISRRSVQKQELNHHLGQFSDCEDEKEMITADKSPKLNTSYLNTSSIKPVFQQFTSAHKQNFNHKSFQNVRSTNSTTTATNESLNLSFLSAKNNITHDFLSVSDTASVSNNSLVDHNRSSDKKDCDIDVSLNRLHLGTPKVRKSPPLNTFYMNHDIPRPKPVISPPKLKNVTQNSWVAGGFWRDSNGILLPLNNFTNLSRSSSQTSGFVSLDPHNYHSSPPSLNNSLCGDLECNSLLSEPTYCMMQGRNLAPRVDPTRAFCPILNHEQMVYIAPFGFNNVFMNRNNKFSNVGQPGFGMHNSRKNFSNNYRTKDWCDKDF